MEAIFCFFFGSFFPLYFACSDALSPSVGYQWKRQQQKLIHFRISPQCIIFHEKWTQNTWGFNFPFEQLMWFITSNMTYDLSEKQKSTIVQPFVGKNLSFE
jgi:hypothetical protein